MFSKYSEQDTHSGSGGDDDDDGGGAAIAIAFLQHTSKSSSSTYTVPANCTLFADARADTRSLCI